MHVYANQNKLFTIKTSIKSKVKKFLQLKKKHEYL